MRARLSKEARDGRRQSEGEVPECCRYARGDCLGTKRRGFKGHSSMRKSLNEGVSMEQTLDVKEEDEAALLGSGESEGESHVWPGFGRPR